jgi:hypothetical protein
VAQEALHGQGSGGGAPGDPWAVLVDDAMVMSDVVLVIDGATDDDMLDGGTSNDANDAGGAGVGAGVDQATTLATISSSKDAVDGGSCTEAGAGGAGSDGGGGAGAGGGVVVDQTISSASL